MNEITTKLSRKAIKGFEPIGLMLRESGKTDREIIRAFNDYVNSKVLNYYNSRKRLFGIGALLKLSVEDLKKKKGYDSKAEVIFESLLRKNKIPFKYHYKIGPYEADFLVDEFLVVEIDGALHNSEHQKEHDSKRDKYIKKMGYQILRLPIWIISMSEQAVIEEIKEIIGKG